jgi:hypothetical protein
MREGDVRSLCELVLVLNFEIFGLLTGFCLVDF